MGDIRVRTSKLAALPRSKALRERYGGGVASGQAGAGLSGAYLTVAEFATYFRKVGSEDGESSLIEAQLPLYSLGEVAAFGAGTGTPGAGGDGGGIDGERLAEWMAEKGYATQAWVASRGFLTAGALDGFLKEHQSLSHLVTLGTDQAVTGAKTFTQAVTARASAPFVGQNPLADRKLQLDAFENWGAMRLYGTGGNYVNLRPLTTATGAMLTHNDDDGAWDWDLELQVGRIALMDGSMYLDGGFASRLWWDAESARVRINRPLVSSGIMYAERFFADTTNICTNLNADLLDGKHLADILASNVASATRLQTARKLWGQSFDGTGDVDGRLTVDMTLANTTWVSDSGQIRLNTDNAKYSLGLGVASTGMAAVQSGEHGVGAIPLLLNPQGGNVGIRTSNPTEALHVYGTARFNAVKLPDGSGVTWDGGAVMWYDAAGDCFRVNRPVVASGDVTAFS